MKLPKYWKVKPIKIHFNLDTDKDGVLDRFDCRPFDYWRQDEDSYVVKISDRFPSGLTKPSKDFLKQQRLAFGEVKIKKPKPTVKRTPKKAVSSLKARTALDLRTIKVDSELEFFDICDDLRDEGYEEFFVSKDWRDVVKEEKILNAYGYKHFRFVYYDGYYLMWGKIR